MKVLVTGGSGFVGTNAVRILLERGHDVLSIDVKHPVDRTLTSAHQDIDLCDHAALAKVVRDYRPEVILHLGARTDLGGRSPEIDYAANVDGVSNLIAAIDQSGSVRHVIFASSRLAVARSADELVPSSEAITAYGASKAIGERIVRERGPHEASWTIIRPTSVWGPWFGEPNLPFFRLVGRGLYVHATGHNPLKQYSYVDNLVHQMIVIASSPRERVHEKVMYVTDYDAFTLREWSEEIGRWMGAPRIRSVPFPMLRLAARVGDSLKPAWSGVPLTSFRLENLVATVQFDVSEVREIVPDLPVQWRVGVERTVRWMREESR